MYNKLFLLTLALLLSNNIHSMESIEINKREDLNRILFLTEAKKILTESGAKKFEEDLSPRSKRFFQKAYEENLPSVCGLDMKHFEIGYREVSKSKNLEDLLESIKKCNWGNGVANKIEKLHNENKRFDSSNAFKKETFPYLIEIYKNKDVATIEFLENLSPENSISPIKSKILFFCAEKNKFLLSIKKKDSCLKFKLNEINRDEKINKKPYNKAEIFFAFDHKKKNKLNFRNFNIEDYLSEKKEWIEYINPLDNRGMTSFVSQYWMNLLKFALENEVKK